MEPWMEDELVKDIPKEKLEFLARIMTGSKGKNQKQLMGALIPLMKEAQSKGLQFTTAETTAAIAAIRKYSSQEENAKIDEILQKVDHAKGNKGVAP